ncbi:MAG: acetylglutamate kinase [Terriglobia bacterium]|jgi:acetylglutamate kinase
MKLVIKIGGQGAEDPKGRKDLARQIAEIRRAGHSVVMVHGGGKLLTRTLERLGMTTEFHQGLRVTDAATRDVAMMVLAGLVNKQWVAELETLRQPALGLCGGDGGMVRARKLTVGVNGSKRDLGFVGRPYKVNTTVLDLALSGGLIPVVASLGVNARGEFLNINADDLAAALAVALGADRLLYLTESGGVWDAEKNLLPVVRLGDIRRLINQGVVRDGMIPKLLSCARTLRQNVGEVDILSTTAPNALLSAIKKGKTAGTRIVKGS